MGIKIVNVGLVKALWVGNTAPENKNMLWRDTSLAIPLHKFYNQSTSLWEAFIYATIVDNDTIKVNGNGQLYVDEAALAGYVLGDGTVTLAKMADVASGTVFYRKTAGSGPPEVQTLEQLKTDLGISGNNTGDQDLSIYVVKTTTINGKELSSNIILVPTDIGSPSGSGSSTGTNTGDETKGSILGKLEIENISGLNTGDQTAATVPVEDAAGVFTGNNVEVILKELYDLILSKNNFFKISLPAYTSVSERCLNAVEGTDYPTGWILEEDISDLDISITHNLNRSIADVKIFMVDNGEERILLNNLAYSGFVAKSKNRLVIESLSQVGYPIVIHLIFA